MKTMYKIILGGITGALAGYAYYYFIGCSNGQCPLTSTWYITTLYGAGIGSLLFIPAKKSKTKDEEEHPELKNQ